MWSGFPQIIRMSSTLTTEPSPHSYPSLNQFKSICSFSLPLFLSLPISLSLCPSPLWVDVNSIHNPTLFLRAEEMNHWPKELSKQASKKNIVWIPRAHVKTRYLTWTSVFSFSGKEMGQKPRESSETYEIGSLLWKKTNAAKRPWLK